MEPRYPFVAVDVLAEAAEELGALFFELGATGVEERDSSTLAKSLEAGKVTLVASFDDHETAHAAIANLRDEYELTARLEEIVGDAWRDAWKEHFAPFALTSRMVVTPPWIAYSRKGTADDPDFVLELEPGRAFGTGLHATTSLIATYLDRNAASLAGQRVLDVGTGSGILGLVALLYGAVSAECIDNDGDVIEVVRENAERNHLADRVKAYQATVDEVKEQFPWVLANIETRVLGPIATDLVRAVAPGGHLVLSGILGREADHMVHTYTNIAGRPLRYVATDMRDDASGEPWVSLAFVCGRESAQS